MPSFSSEFAFHEAATHFRALGEALNSLPSIEPLDGEGATSDAANGILQEHQQWLSSMAMKASEIAQACAQQHGVDVQLAQAPSVQDVKDAEQRFHDANGEDKIQKLSEYRELKEKHDAAVATHASGTVPTEGALGGVVLPTSPGGHWGDDDSGYNPSTGGSGGTATAGGDGSGSGAAGTTSLSGDTADAGTATKPMLGGQPPQMPPMQPQPVMAPPQMPQGGAGGGYPSMPPMAGATPRDRKDKDGKDPLDDLRTDLSGNGDGAGVGAAAALNVNTSPTDRGATTQGAHTRADVSGINRPAVGGGAGQAPPPQPQQGGMMGGPMGSGAGGAGSGKPKPRPEIKSSDPAQVGHDSVAEAIPGGLFGSLPESTDNGSKNISGKRWDQLQGKWVDEGWNR